MRPFTIRETCPRITCSTCTFFLYFQLLPVFLRDFMSLCGTSFDYTQTNTLLQNIKYSISTYKRLMLPYWLLMQVHLEVEFSKLFASIQLAFSRQVIGICLCGTLYTCTCLSSLRGVLSGGLCVSAYPLIFQGHPEDSCAHSHANWQQIDLLSCFKTVVNSGSTVPPLWGSHICICVYSAFGLAHKKPLSWNDKEQKQLILLEGKYPQSPYQRKRERTGGREGDSDNYKKSDSYYFKHSGCCGSLV